MATASKKTEAPKKKSTPKKVKVEEKIVEEVAVEKVEKENTPSTEKKKVYFFQRLAAYIIDIMILMMVATAITSPVINVDSVNKLSKESNTVMKRFTDQKIDTKTYISQSTDISYDLAKQTGMATIITIAIYILYFVVFQCLRNGQTIGKQLMKIRIVKKDHSELTMNNLIFRNMINNFILSDMIVLTIVMVASKDVYFYGTGLIEAIQYGVVAISAFMIMFREDGRSIPDLIGNTVVVRSDDFKKE